MPILAKIFCKQKLTVLYTNILLYKILIFRMNRIIVTNTNVLKRSLMISSNLINKQTNKEVNIKLSKVNKNMNLAGTYYEMFDIDIGNVFHL